MVFPYGEIMMNFMNNESEDSSYDGEGSAYEDSSSEDELQMSVPPLFEAIERRENLSMIRHYLSDCHINAVDILNNSCLHVAVSVSPYDLNVIKELLEHGAEINLPNWKENTPLHSASENSLCDVDLIKVLLDHGANPNAKNIYKDTPLHLFVMKCLQESNNNRNLEIIKLLLESGAKPSFENSIYVTPFLMAVHPPYCHLSSYVGLVKFGADFSVTRSNESLLDKPLLPTSTHSHDIIKLFLQHKPSLVHYRDRRRRTPLHIALFGGASVDVVKELINKGAYVNARDDLFNTPLHVTTLSSYSVIETLVKYGAEINAVNQNDNTPLLEAFLHRLNIINPTAIIALLELGANLEIHKYYGKSALYYAMTNSSVPLDVVKLLLEKSDEPFHIESQEVIADYDFSSNKRAALLYLQYFLFYKMRTKYIITEDDKPEQFISFDKYGPALCNNLSNFRDNCLSEVLNMKYDRLSDGTDLYFYVHRNIGVIRRRYRYPVSLIKEVLVRIHSNKYPNCTDLLRACIKRDRLLNYLPVLTVYTSVLDTTNSKQSIILDYFSTMNLAKFLDRDTLLGLVEAFSDDFSSYKRRRLCSTPCRNIFKSSTKRKLGI